MLNAHMATQEKTISEILAYYPLQKDAALIERAFRVAQTAHEGQKRASGEPYIVHPLETARTLADMHLDPATIAAALLHDVVEDAGVAPERIEKEFGKEVAFLVQGVTKLGKLKYRGEERHAESLRKMLLAMAEDIRVVLIKFADRLHNMRTLAALEDHPDKQRRIALETLEIYAPIALRLGVNELAKRLEDLAFPILYPIEYAEVQREIKKRYPAREKRLARIKPLLLRELKKEDIAPFALQTRTKHMYSLWRKLQKHQGNWDTIYDLVAGRIIVKNVEDCYGALGVIHKLWKPLPGRIKDYIALPKLNGYQSLHTTVFGPHGTPIEFQIRTREMHEHAENGIAAHWAYTELGKPKKGSAVRSPKLSWVRQIREWQKEFRETEEFLEGLKIDAFEDRIFVFTPQGDVIDLPEGATPVDFAYAIHSKLGNECAGAKVNGKMVPLNHELQSGDVLDIIRAKGRMPSSAWLSFVQTSEARSHIKAELRKAGQEEHVAKGIELINQELGALQKATWEKLPKEKKNRLREAFRLKTIEDVLAGIGLGEISLRRVLKYLVDEKEVFAEPSRRTITAPAAEMAIPLVSGERGIQTRIAQCCKPILGEKIVAYVTVQKGASIHKESCKSVHARSNTSARLLPARWQGEKKHTGIVQLEMITEDRVGLLQDISSTVSNQGINMTSTHSEATPGGGAMVRLNVEVHSLEKLQTLIRKLRAIRSVQTVKRA